jgi:thiamine biosynthesis lipoprotein ApbE
VTPLPLVQLSELEDLEMFRHEAMATSFIIYLGPTAGVNLRALAEEAFRLVDRIEDLLSFYREGSDITRINRAKPGEVVRINEITHRCLLTALEVSAASHNAFNPFTGRAAVTAKGQQVPAHLIDLALPVEDEEHPVLSLDPATPQITKLTGTRWLDLGAIGKGAALDAVAELLQEWEVSTAVLVSGGSSVLVFGQPLKASTPAWPLTIPLDPAPITLSVPTPFALGASGQGFQPGHVIGRTELSQRPQSVVVAPSAAVADALSTAALLLPDLELRQLMGDEPTFSVLATQINAPALQTGLFASLPLAQIQVSLAIPCWCESSRLPKFLAELAEAIAQSNLLVEIMVVDDGSPEAEVKATRAAVDAIGRKYRFVRSLISAPHQGKGGAIYRGWEAASTSAKWLAFVDADGAIPAFEVVRGLKLMIASSEDHQLLAASRYHRDATRTVHRRFIRQRTGGWFARWAQRKLRLEADDSQCGFKIVPALWWRNHAPWSELGYAFDLELLVTARDDRLPVINFPISWQEIGGSNVTWRDGIRLVDAVKRFDP